jgi:ribonuclease Z
MSLLGRKAPLQIWGPPGLSDWLGATWKAISAHHTFSFQVLEWSGEKGCVIHEEERYRLFSFPVKHRIDACGIRIEEHGLKWKLKGDLVRQANLPFDVRKQLQSGEVVNWKDQQLHPGDWAGAPRPPRSYVFSGDTRPCESLKEAANSATVLCHDATFLHRDADKAKSTHHSTVKEAARLAAQAEVGKLVLTHISSRYKDMAEFEEESREFDIPVELAHDGMKISL